MGFLSGKRALIVGVASNRSIAWGIAQAMAREGASLALTYQNDKLQDRVGKLAEELGASWTVPCDVSQDAEIEQVAETLGQHWDGVDILVHSVAFAPRDQLQGEYVANTTREGFATTHDVSVYSLTALARVLRPLMRGRNGSIVTMTYLGSERAMPNYNVMGVAKASLEASVRYLAQDLGPDGIRVNAVSAGPIKTLAASGIADFRSFLDHVEGSAPLHRNVTIEDVGNTAAFLGSDLAGGITGEVIYVDSGYNIIGMA